MRIARYSSSVLLTALAAAVLVSGCSGHGASVTTPGLAATPTPTATTLTIKEAGARYLQLVRPSNKALGALTAEARKPHPSLPKLRRLATAAANADHQFAVGLTTTAWPPEVQSLVDKVAAAVATDLTACREIAAAKTLAHVNAASADFSPDSSSRSAAPRQTGPAGDPDRLETPFGQVPVDGRPMDPELAGCPDPHAPATGSGQHTPPGPPAGH